MGNELLDENLCDIVAEMNMGNTCDMPFAYRIGRPDRIVEYRFNGRKKQTSRETVIENVTVDGLAARINRARMKMENEMANLRKENATLCEALKRIVAASIVPKNSNAPEWILQRMASVFSMATTALLAATATAERSRPGLTPSTKHASGGTRKRGMLEPSDFGKLY